MKRDFEERKREIRRYLNFVVSLDSRKTRIVRGATADLKYSHIEEQELLKTLKANLFLLLYNLVESTVKNAIEAIFERLSRDRVNIDSCRSELQQVVLKNLRSHNVQKIHAELKTFAIDVVAKTFRKEKLFSGNVDAREIRETAKTFGFSNPVKDGSELLTVKTNRNDLAHGDKTFSAVGADYDVQRLRNIAKDVFAYLLEFINNIQSYLKSKSYLQPI